MSPKRRPEGEYRSAKHEGIPIGAAGPTQGANYSPSGGSAAAKPQAWGSFR